MNAVVIRCPNCGTTQRELGTCDTCHEAEVGYFCPNHSPGRWIDGPSCDACGARFGVEAPPATGPVSTPRETSRPTERRPVEWRPPARTRSGGPRPGGVPRSPRHPDELDDPVRGDPLDASGTRAPDLDPRLAELLEHMRRARGMPPGRPTRGGEGGFTPVDPAAVARGVARGAIGCVGRLVMVIVVLAILAMLALGGFFGGIGYADLDDRRAIATSSAHARDHHALHLDAVPHPRQGGLDLRAGA